MRQGQRCARGTAADKCVPLTLDRLIGTAARLWWLDNYMQPGWRRAGHRSLAVQVKKEGKGCEWRHVEHIKKWKQVFFFPSQYESIITRDVPYGLQINHYQIENILVG